MARKPRVHYNGAYYHVMLRGNGGMTIFHDTTDYKNFLNLIKESIIKFEYRIHAFCLMTNHVHFALQVGNIPLSKIIQNISFRYTRFINKKQKRIGHLFQGRYKALLVDEDCYLLQLIKYIHLNPLRANMVENLNDYPWSSHLIYLGYKKNNWLTTESVYNLLTASKNTTLISYHKFISDKSHDPDINFDLSIQKSFPAICDDAFMAKLENKQKTNFCNIKIKLVTLVELICNYFGVDESELHTNSRKRFAAKIRFITTKLAIEFNIATITEVAKYFSRDVSTLSRGLAKTLNHNEKIFCDIRMLIESTIAKRLILKSQNAITQA